MGGGREEGLFSLCQLGGNYGPFSGAIIDFPVPTS